MQRRNLTYFLVLVSLVAIFCFCLAGPSTFVSTFQQEPVPITIQETELPETQTWKHVSRVPDKREAPEELPSQDITVYITKTGARYHLIDCRSLYQSQIPVTLEEALAQGYTPCGHCLPELEYPQ